jgi:hypothetical protein
MRKSGVLWYSVLASVLAASPLIAQEDEVIPDLADGREPAQVMILGVFHFHNPGADLAQFEGIDVLTPEHQKEIQDIADGLARFAPTRIAVEKSYDEADSLNAEYQGYLSGELELRSNEVHQLGFRLGKMFGHDWMYPVDYRLGMDFDAMMGYASENDPEYMERFFRIIAEYEKLFNRMQSEETIAYNLRFMNYRQNMAPAHAPYAEQATIGGGDTFIGAEVIAGWYERNLKIFANLAKVAQPGERVLLIIGGGHLPTIREQVIAHPTMQLVESVDYLPED